MPSVFDSTTRAELERRIASVSPNSPRRWGRMSPQQMVCHLSDQVRVALGDLPTKPMSAPLRYWPLKQFVIGPLPWPHGAKSPPETRTTKPGEFARDKATLNELLVRLGVVRQRPFAARCR